MLFLWAAIIALAAVVAHKVNQNRRWEECNEQDRARLRAAIEADPKNLGAYELLGDSYRQSNKLEQACDWYKRALRFDVAETNHTVRYKLEQVQMDIDKSKAGFFSIPETWLRTKRIAAEVLFCPQCGASNLPHRTRCEVCDEILLQSSIIGSARELWHDPRSRKALIVIALNCLFFSVLISIMFSLPPIFAGVLLAASFIATAFIYLQRIDGSR
jgi:tetratricopeptide (TPR) repeat protein